MTKSSEFNGQILSGYGLGFYTDYVFTHSPRIFAYNAIIFGVDSPENNNVLAIGKGNVKINNKTVGVNAPYKSNISAPVVKIIRSLYYNKKIAIFFQMVIK